MTTPSSQTFDELQFRHPLIDGLEIAEAVDQLLDANEILYLLKQVGQSATFNLMLGKAIHRDSWAMGGTPRGSYGGARLGADSPAAGRPILRQGAKGDDVKYLQNALTAAGFDTKGIDGSWGANTTAALRKFQAANGLAVDGIAGPGTWAALAGNAGGGSTPAASPAAPGQAPDAKTIADAQKLLPLDNLQPVTADTLRAKGIDPTTPVNPDGTLKLSPAAATASSPSPTAPVGSTSFRKLLDVAGKAVKSAQRFVAASHPLTVQSTIDAWKGDVNEATRIFKLLLDTVDQAEADPVGYGKKWLDTAAALKSQLDDMTWTADLKQWAKDYANFYLDCAKTVAQAPAKTIEVAKNVGTKTAAVVKQAGQKIEQEAEAGFQAAKKELTSLYRWAPWVGLGLGLLMLKNLLDEI